MKGHIFAVSLSNRLGRDHTDFDYTKSSSQLFFCAGGVGQIDPKWFRHLERWNIYYGGEGGRKYIPAVGIFYLDPHTLKEADCYLVKE